MSNKTISINPSLFKIGGTKTQKKNKNKEESKSLKPLKPLIHPNILKNKLLKRIKEHKQRETQDIDKKNKGKDNNNKTTPETNVNTFTDEFSESMNYLQSLSKQKKKENLENKTVKHYKSMENDTHTQPHVNLELPEELKISEGVIKMPEELIKINTVPKVDNVVPYGILKGGVKPTYRNWAKTQRNSIVSNPNAAITIEGGREQREKTEREKRLQILREKLKNKKKEEPVTSVVINQESVPICMDTEPRKPTEPTESREPREQHLNVAPTEKVIATKKITKTIIKKKYTLGKSKTKKTVGVLIKDRENRKNIISAQKSLKKKSINDINTYLREHNLIKTGSGAPNDVKRKIYESAMLAGEVRNTNSETLLHNLSNVEKEL